MAKYEEVSKRLSRCIDCLGYNARMRIYRNMILHHNDQLKSSPLNHLVIVSVGSRKEGVARVLESDLDKLYIHKNVLCIEEGLSVGLHQEPTNVFSVDTTVCRPGYCTLRLVQYDFSWPKMDNALWLFTSGYYLSSNEWKSESLSLEKNGKFGSHISGPAVTKTLPGVGEIDFVFTLPCLCPTILYQWMTRTRVNDWPPLHVRQRIAQMEGNVVATASKGSGIQCIEWRLCFNEVEILLVKSLNDTQMKLYRLLKMIKCDLLKPLHYQITSYLLKNIVFWLAERYPGAMFRNDNLFYWVIKSLRLLKRSIKLFFLPYYMIPARNLLTEKVEPSESGKLVHDLSEIIHSGPNILYRLKKLDIVMNLTPVELLEFREKRDRLEMLAFSYNSFLQEKDVPALTEVNARIHELMSSYWPEKVQEYINSHSTDEVVNFLLH